VLQLVEILSDTLLFLGRWWVSVVLYELLKVIAVD
jgi:hypothetical protein